MATSMKLMVTMESDVFVIEVNEQLEVETLEALCEIETGISTSEFQLVAHGRFLTDGKKCLAEVPLKDGDVVLLHRVNDNPTCAAVQSSTDHQSATTPTVADGASIDIQSTVPPDGGGGDDDGEALTEFAALSEDRRRRLVREAVALREALLSRPEEVKILQRRNPTLAEALVKGNATSFASVIHRMRCQQEKQQIEHQQQRHQRNLLDPRVQEMIAEEIRQKNVESNRAAAAEFSPEMFAKVTMLFVPIKVNGHLVKAFVDTGAQTTLINVPCAKRCDLMHLLDRSYAGVAYGVGTQRIIGRVHVAVMQIGPEFVESSFNVVENEPLEMLLGLDTLKRHRCIVDLNRNALIVGGGGSSTAAASTITSESVVQFLEGSDLPDISGVARKDEEEMDESLKDIDERRINGGSVDHLAETLAMALGQMQAATTKDGDAVPGHGGEAVTADLVVEEEVEKLVQMGFERSQAKNELLLQGGDVDQTVAALLAKSLSFC